MATDARRAWAQTLVGRTVGERYRLDALLDVGGMGAVFRARHLEVDRPVAVKTVVPGALSDAQTERLRREARRAAAVGGRGVVDVTDFGVDEVCGPFLVMELLEGETLGAHLYRRDRLSSARAFEIADAVLATLGIVHEQGLVHRDLKPDNLFLARMDGEEVVKILDFGIARPVRSTGDTLTKPGAVVGTPRFMAPEQARGARDVDARADVYAVGAILYAMLAGRPPYEDLDSAEALVAVVAGPPRPVRELAPDVPEPVTKLIERAMQRAPEERFRNATEMRAALREAVGAPPAEPTRSAASAGNAAIDRGGVRSASGAIGEADTVRAPDETDRTRDPSSSIPRARASRAMRWVPWLVGLAAATLLAAWVGVSAHGEQREVTVPVAGAGPPEGGPSTDDSPGAEASGVVDTEAQPGASEASSAGLGPSDGEPSDGEARDGETSVEVSRAGQPGGVEPAGEEARGPAPRASSPGRSRDARRAATRGADRAAPHRREAGSAAEPAPEAPSERAPPSTAETEDESPGRTGGLSMEDF